VGPCLDGGEDAVGEGEVWEGVVACADEAEDEGGLRDGVLSLSGC